MPKPSLREVIVETAVDELHRHGYCACSVDTITRAAGVPKGSFYNHFKSKEELGAVAVGRYAAESTWHDTFPQLSPLGQLRARFTVMRDALVANSYARGCLIGNMSAEQADHSEVIRAVVKDALAAWSDSITESIKDAQAVGEVAADIDAARLGRFVLNAWEGALIRAKAVRGAEPLDDFFEVVFGTVLR
jgi:TetR/AcrR family transcriptional repressor of nem operon